MKKIVYQGGDYILMQKVNERPVDIADISNAIDKTLFHSIGNKFLDFIFLINSLVISVLMLGGCSTMSPGKISGSGYETILNTKIAPEPIQPVQASKDGQKFEVYYATNRSPRDLNNEKYGYSSDGKVSSVHYGVAHLLIPKVFLEALRPSWVVQQLQKYGIEKTAGEYIALRKLEPLGASQFWGRIETDLLASNSEQHNDMLVFIHGFKNDFMSAAQRAAAIGFYAHIPQTALFSWPSYNRVGYYEADRDAIISSADSIADFLIELHRQVKKRGGKLHVVAHSMGGFGLLQAMYRPKMQDALSHGFGFGQVILAAADVDDTLFERDQEALVRHADHVTVYASSFDDALAASSAVAGLRPRIGSMSEPMIIPNVDTIDVSYVDPTLIGHAYVDCSLAVLSDLNNILGCKDTPKCWSASARNLEKKAFLQGAYWVLNKVP